MHPIRIGILAHNRFGHEPVTALQELEVILSRQTKNEASDLINHPDANGHQKYETLSLKTLVTRKKSAPGVLSMPEERRWIIS